MQTQKYPLVTYSREEGFDIVFAEFNNNLKIDLDVAKELVENRMEFTKNEKHYVVIDFSNIKHYTHEAKVYMRSPDMGAKNILGGAFIAHNPVSALLASIFIKTLKNVPAKFFFSKKEAIKWIYELRIKQQKQ